jgi:hypothetical protein
LQQPKTTPKLLLVIGTLVILVAVAPLLMLNLDSVTQNAATIRGGRDAHETFSASASSSRLPPGKQYPFKVAICVLMKDAENYFEEWLDYHLAMGFDAIYIYDNSPSFELNNWFDNTRNHTTLGKVEVMHWLDDSIYNQNNAYEDCVEKFGHSETGPKIDYFAFIDVDEFLVIRSPKYNDIQGILTDYLVPYGGALTVNWMMVGSSNKTVSSPLPITKRNQYRAKETHNVVKSFVKASEYIEHKNPHAVEVQSPATIQTTKYPGALFKPLLVIMNVRQTFFYCTTTVMGAERNTFLRDVSEEMQKEVACGVTVMTSKQTTPRITYKLLPGMSSMIQRGNS